MATEKPKAKVTDDESIIETAKKRFALAETFDKENYDNAVSDWKFRAGEQWPEAIKLQRQNEGRPTLVINRILQPIRQVTNDQRQNRPSIKVHPVDDRADIETAKVYQGMIRHIEQDSNADVAYDTAFEGAAIGGIGYFRVFTEYCDPRSFEQQAKIGLIDDFLKVRFDPFSEQPDGSDANWAFICKDIPKDDYIAEYGESKLAATDDWSAYGEQHGDWIKKDAVRVVEYFCKEYKTEKIYLLADGTTTTAEELEQLKAEAPDVVTDEKIKAEIIDERTTKVPVICWYKLNGIEVLDKTEFPGQYIPIIPVYGDKYVIEGKRVLEGIVRHAKDPSRMYNYHKSTEAETIALSPKAPFVAAEGQIPPEYAQQWKNANSKTYAYLTYKPTDLNGTLVPPPQRQVFEAPIQAVTQASMSASEDIKSTTGIYDAALGRQSNETSGIAIQRRAMQGQTSNYHLIDNLTRSIRHCGRILVGIIPHVYDTARAARIIGEEGEEEIIRINQVFEHKGEQKEYNLSAGKYDVSVDTGPSYATKRQEAAASMIELAKSSPNIMQIAGDLFVKSLDIPGASEIAERMKKTLPPGLAEDKEQKPLPPEVQAQMQQMSQMIEQLTAHVNEQSETIKTKKLELESRERIEAMKQETQILIEKMKQAQAGAQFQVETQLAQLNAIQGEEEQFEQENLAPEGQQPNQPAGAYVPGAEEQL